MLQKLLSHEAFQPIRPWPSKDQHSAKFKEDGQLYKFPSANGIKPNRPLSTYNGQTRHMSFDHQIVADDESDKISPEAIWADEFYAHLAKLLKLEAEVENKIFSNKTVDIENVIQNTVIIRSRPDTAEIIPDFVQSAMRALENCMFFVLLY